MRDRKWRLIRWRRMRRSAADGWLQASKFIGGDDTHHVIRIEFKAGYSVSVMEMAEVN